MRSIVCMEDLVVIENILTHLDAKTTEANALQRPPCRAPPQRGLLNQAGSADNHHPGAATPPRGQGGGGPGARRAEKNAPTNLSSGWIRTPGCHSRDHWRVRAV